MIIKGRQWHFQRCLIALSAVFLALTIFCSAATAQGNGTCTISGNVVDQKGNSVPGAFVELIMNGSIPRIANNPQLSGDGRMKPFGSFNFTGLVPGEYIIIAEITTPTSGTYNDSTSVSVVGGMVNTDVKLAKYVYTYSTPTPVPTPAPTVQAVQENTIAVTPVPIASDSSETTDSGIGGLFKNSTALIMIGMFSFIIVGGAGVFTISSRSGQSERHFDHRAPKKEDRVHDNQGSISGADAYPDMQGYEEDIACIIKIKKEGNILGAEYYQLVNDMAEKYEMNQSTIMYDISKRLKVK